MKKFIKLFVIMYFLSGFVINFVKQPLNSNNSDQEITTIQYKIRSGDTLWDIADNFNPSNKNLKYLITDTNGKVLRNSFNLSTLLKYTNWKKL